MPRYTQDMQAPLNLPASYGPAAVYLLLSPKNRLVVQRFYRPILEEPKRQCSVTKYLLLLEDAANQEIPRAASPYEESEEDGEQASDRAGAIAAKRLILELFLPKIQELRQMTESWRKREGDVSLPMSGNDCRV